MRGRSQKQRAMKERGSASHAPEATDQIGHKPDESATDCRPESDREDPDYEGKNLGAHPDPRAEELDACPQDADDRDHDNKQNHDMDDFIEGKAHGYSFWR